MLRENGSQRKITAKCDVNWGSILIGSHNKAALGHTMYTSTMATGVNRCPVCLGGRDPACCDYLNNKTNKNKKTMTRSCYLCKKRKSTKDEQITLHK
ncbi:hypothetical protein ALC62_00869 [Cyphomyrmex costatus]|uniref:Uncharacterized protein n=1 Tax=Cyphomyrmex costatus TaxID=456900 RepID=A0A195D6H4_9HYME|nr:hypothetical protein ALC62_00869 [Cyphomyrmex costatus]